MFVANRIAEIERHSHIGSWRHVPSEFNVADVVSRGMTAESFANSSIWRNGPEFLQHSSGEWPEQLDKLSELPDDFPMLERKVNYLQPVVLAACVTNDLPSDQLVSHFSTLFRLKRAVAWLRRFFKYMKDRTCIKDRGRMLEIEELRAAENCLVMYCQRKRFSTVLEAIRSGRSLSSVSCSMQLQKQNPFVHEVMLRVGGRLAKASVAFDTQHPAILPSADHLTYLIINHYYRLVGHSGVSHTFCAVRERYWVEKGSVAIRKVVDECMSCRRWRAPRGE